MPEFDFSDGGELKCGICGGSCREHYRLFDVLDIGPCCLEFMKTAAQAGCTQNECLALLGGGR